MDNPLQGMTPEQIEAIKAYIQQQDSTLAAVAATPAPVTTSPTNINSDEALIRVVTQEYVTSLPSGLRLADLLNPARCDQINSDLMDAYTLKGQTANAIRPKSMPRINIPKRLPGEAAAAVVIATGDIRVAKTGTSGSQLVARQYYTDNTGTVKRAGYWRIIDIKSESDQIFDVYRSLCPSGTAADRNKFIEHLYRAPTGYIPSAITHDKDLVYFRNGVWDARKKALIPYDAPNFDKDYPEINLGKLPVYHPYGAGSPLMVNPDGTVDQPAFKKHDGTYWHPLDMFTELFDMSSEEGKATSKVILQATQFMIRRMNGLPGYYHFWINGDGKGHNGKGALWALMKRLIEKPLAIGDDDLDTTKRVLPVPIERLGEDYTLAEGIMTAYAIVGEESNTASAYVDDCDVAKNLSRVGQEITFRQIYGRPFKYAFAGLLLQQANESPTFSEKTDSMITHSLVCRFTKHFTDETAYIKDDFVMREETASYMAYYLTCVLPWVDAYDKDACEILKPNARAMMADGMSTVQCLNEILPTLNLEVYPAEMLFSFYLRWCDRARLSSRKIVDLPRFRKDLAQYAAMYADKYTYTTDRKRMPADMPVDGHDLSGYASSSSHGPSEFVEQAPHNTGAKLTYRLHREAFEDGSGNMLRWSKGCLLRKTA